MSPGEYFPVRSFTTSHPVAFYSFSNMLEREPSFCFWLCSLCGETCKGSDKRDMTKRKLHTLCFVPGLAWRNLLEIPSKTKGRVDTDASNNDKTQHKTIPFVFDPLCSARTFLWHKPKPNKGYRYCFLSVNHCYQSRQ